MLSVNVPTEAHPAVGHGQVWNICLSVGKVQIQTVKHNNRDCWFEEKKNINKPPVVCSSSDMNIKKLWICTKKWSVQVAHNSVHEDLGCSPHLQSCIAPTSERPLICADMFRPCRRNSLRQTRRKQKQRRGGLTFRDAVCSRPRECSWRVRVTEMRLNPESTYGKTNTVSVTPSHASHTQPTTT